MGVWRKRLGGGSYQDTVQYKMSAAITEGQVVIVDATLTDPGDVQNSASATAALNSIGCCLDTATYTTTQAADMVEGLVRLCQDPFAVWEFRVSGNGTTGVALVAATTTPSNIFSNDTASTSGLTITDTAVGVVQRTGTIIKGRTGANAGTTRKVAAHTDSTSCAVTVPFPNDIAVGDTFLCVGYGLQHIELTLTATDGTPAATLPQYAEADGTTGTDNDGIESACVAVLMDEWNDTAVVQVILRDHLFNALAP